MGHFIKNYRFKGFLTTVDSILGLCLIFENKTDVDPGDNVVQLIKAHSLHILFADFEKNRN